MREILYRGKRIDDGAWVEGFFVAKADPLLGIMASFTLTQEFDTNGTLRSNMDWHKVDPETVGQHTGLTDKNGKKIFEGDVFHLDDEVVAVVIFQDGCFRLEEYGLRGAFTESGFDECGGGWDVIDCSPIDWYTIKDMEIIGNIHDNPELLEEG